MLSLLLFYSFQFISIFLGVFKNPVFLIAGYFTVYFLYHDSRWWFTSAASFSYSFVFSVAILAFAFLTKKSEESVFKHGPVILMILLGILYLMTNLWAIAPELHAESTDDFIKLILISIASIFLVKNKRDFDIVVWAYVIGCTYIGYYIQLFGRSDGRVYGVGMVDSPDINDLAALLTIGAYFSLYLFWKSKLAIKPIVVVCGALILNGIVLINSRGAFLAILVGGLWFVFQMFKSNVNISKKNLKLAGLCFVGLIGLAIVIDQSAINRFLSIKTQSQLTTEVETGSTRVFFWKASIQMSTDYPMGAGSNGFLTLSPYYIPENVATGESRNRAVHSSWFQALTEVGYLGLGIFILMIMWSFSYLKKLKKRLTDSTLTNQFVLVVCVESALIAYLTAITFIDRFRAVVLYILIAMVVMLFRVIMFDKESNSISEQKSEASIKPRRRAIQ